MSRRIETTLGPSLELQAGVWVLDLEELVLLHGLSILSRALGERVLSQARSDRIDITVEREVRESENPELLGRYGVRMLQLRAEHRAVADILRDPDRFQDRLRTIFGTLQRPGYREALFPELAPERPEGEPTPRSRALVFDLAEGGSADDASGARQRVVLERVASAQTPRRCFLRITVEDPQGRRLDLGSVPHVQVADLDSRLFVGGSTRIAQTLADAVQREAARGRRNLIEQKRAHAHTFQQLAKAGLGHFEELQVHWGDDIVPFLLEDDSGALGRLLKRVLLALEDVGLRGLVERGEIVRIDAGGRSVFVDASQLGRVLNLSLGRHRERLDVDHFLARMPATRAVAEQNPSRPLEGLSVFLVHHITAEVLGLIAALRRLGCRDLRVLFVAYAGDAPSGYLGPLLELPPDEFQAMALVNVPEADSVEGHYRLSTRYSPLEDAAVWEEVVAAGDPGFFPSMRRAALFGFLDQAVAAERAGRRCLVIEDGGYLAPWLNTLCLEGASRQDAFVRAGAASRPWGGADGPLVEWLTERLLGTVEHTRNGFDRLAAVESEHGRLAFPALSIAISRLKIEGEAREVSMSILNAVENVLAAGGRILRRRHCLVLGAEGAIGSNLMRDLRGRVDAVGEQLCGVDLRCRSGRDGAGRDGGVEVAERIGALSIEARRRVDLIIGVTGVSLVDGAFLEDWLLHSPRPELMLVSGSTKTEEFKGAAAWLESLLAEDAPTLGGRPLRIELAEVSDPLTGRLFAHRYRLRIGGHGDAGERVRDLLLLARLTPINFLFYGVPTELIDEVLAQLVACALAVEGRAAELPPRLLAVDRDVDVRGEAIRPTKTASGDR